MAKPIMTRQQYLNGNVHAFDTPEGKVERAQRHRDYYAQFVNDRTIAYVVRAIGVDALRKSTDPHMNDIPLALWDRLVKGLPLARSLKDAGDYLTLAGGVCIAKEAARQWLERTV